MLKKTKFIKTYEKTRKKTNKFLFGFEKIKILLKLYTKLSIETIIKISRNILSKNASMQFKNI